MSLLEYIDSRKENTIRALTEFVAIPGVSAQAAKRPDVIKTAHWLKARLDALGVQTELRELGQQSLEGQDVPLPPIVMGKLGTDKGKKNLLIYGHFDVQPALLIDGWNTAPFELTRKTDAEGQEALYGRGSTDDKGPIIAWLTAIEALQKQGDLPINLLFCFEGMEESDSVGLNDLIDREKDGYYKDVDMVCVSDNYFLNRKPCLTYGLRGIVPFTLHVEGPARDMHSGVFGGIAQEPMTILTALLATLVTVDGKIQVAGVNELVAPMSDEEAKLYDTIDYSLNDAISGVDSNGGNYLISEDPKQLLKNKMRYPSLSIHGVEGAFYEPGFKTVIPCKVNAKFSIRLVPDMQPADVIKCVQKHIDDHVSKLKTKLKVSLVPQHGAAAWVGDFQHPQYDAAAKAIESVWGVKPDFTREGGSIPVVLTFAKNFGNCLLLPLGRGDDGAHAPNERFYVENMMNGAKVMALYLQNLASV